MVFHANGWSCGEKKGKLQGERVENHVKKEERESMEKQLCF